MAHYDNIIAGYVVLSFENGSIILSIRQLGGGQITALVLGICGTLVCISLCKKKCLQYITSIFIKIGTNSIVVLSYHLIIFCFYRIVLNRCLIPIVGGRITSSYLYDFLVIVMAVITTIFMGEIYGRAKGKYKQVRKQIAGH